MSRTEQLSEKTQPLPENQPPKEAISKIGPFWGRTLRIVAACAALTGSYFLTHQSSAQEESCVQETAHTTSFGENVTIRAACDVRVIQSLSELRGDLRLGEGVTLDSPDEVVGFLDQDPDLLVNKALTNLPGGVPFDEAVRTRVGRLDNVSILIDNKLASLGFNVSAISSDDIFSSVLEGVPQAVNDRIQSTFNEDDTNDLLAEFARNNLDVAPDENGSLKLTGGLVTQSVLNPQNISETVVVPVEFVPPELHDIQNLRFGTQELYWVILQRQAMEDGRIRTLVTFFRNDCINPVIVVIKMERGLPKTPVPGSPTPTPVPPVPTPVRPPVEVVRPTTTPQPTPEVAATQTPAPTETTMPTNTPVPTETQVPPTSTSVPPTETPVSPSPTVRPTSTPQPTPILPTPTIRPTSTPQPTPVPPTATEVPTATKIPPTPTRRPTSTPQSLP